MNNVARVLVDLAQVRALQSEGLSGREIAQRVGVHPSTLYNLCCRADPPIRFPKSSERARTAIKRQKVSTNPPPSPAAIRLAQFDPLMARCLLLRAGVIIPLTPRD